MTTPSLLVRKEIERFLKSRDPEVLCISGSWGIGKTHLWKATLADARHSKKTLGLKKYSYVSLFGIDSLEALKLSIYANLVTLRAWWGPRFVSWYRRKFKQAQPLVEQIPNVGKLLKALGTFYFSMVKKQIVCIDDLERRSEHLRVKDVLGLISYLKEERKCKVVLLLNVGELDKHAIDEFNHYFEKTIDVHLRLSVTVEESAAIAFPAVSAFPRDDDLRRRIKQYCVLLGITNIRILRKIDRWVKDVQPHFKDFDAELYEAAVKGIVLLGWSMLGGTGAPSIEHLKKRTGTITFRPDKNREVPAHEANWDALLDSFQWGQLDEVDLALIGAIESGYFDPEKMQAATSTVWKRVELQRKDGKFEDAWSAYHAGFLDNEDEVMNSLYTTFKQTYETISFMNLNSTIQLFRELGRNDKAEELLKFYIDNRNEPQKFWDLSEDPFSGEVKDAGVRGAIKAKFASFGKTEVNMAEVLDAMGGRGGWNMADVDAIATLPVSDYKEVFKTERGRKLRAIVHGGMLGSRSVGSDHKGVKEVTNKTLAALKEIAAESKLNARRIVSMGVNLNTPDGKTLPGRDNGDDDDVDLSRELGNGPET